MHMYPLCSRSAARPCPGRNCDFLSSLQLLSPPQSFFVFGNFDVREKEGAEWGNDERDEGDSDNDNEDSEEEEEEGKGDGSWM